MQFKDIPGHFEVKRQLTDLVQRNRLSHALLFLGREGSGTLPMAIAFAQYILCEKTSFHRDESVSLFGEQPSEIPLQADSCGTCASCNRTNQLIHPDLHFSYPALKRDSKHDKVLSTDYSAEWREFVYRFPYDNSTFWIDFLKENSKKKIDSPANKQGNISVYECDDISRKLSLKSFESRYKILILWMPEFLGASGNKLLKLIEEPPQDTLFLLVAEDETAILPTILSRTQVIKIPLFSNDEIRDTLINNYNVTPGRATKVASLCEGNFREALQLLETAEDDFQRHIREWMHVILKNNVSAQLKWLDEIHALGREKQKQFLKYFIHLIRVAIRLNFLEDTDSIADEELDFAERLNKMCDISQLESLIGELDNAVYYIERNALGRLLFHSLTIRFYHVIKDKSVILIQ
jgi:DNA polymerase-3 subunit delta'